MLSVFGTAVLMLKAKPINQYTFPKFKNIILCCWFLCLPGCSLYVFVTGIRNRSQNFNQLLSLKNLLKHCLAITSFRLSSPVFGPEPTYLSTNHQFFNYFFVCLSSPMFLWLSFLSVLVTGIRNRSQN